MALTFACPCGASITVPDVLAGHEGRCPGCDAALRAPGAPPPAAAPRVIGRSLSESDEVRLVTGAPGGVLAPATKARLVLEFACPGCREALRVSAAHAGKAGRCSLCGATFQVPQPTAAGDEAAPPRPAEPAAAPTPASGGRDAFRIVKVTCACGKQVPAPLARLEQGAARCPACDRPLASP